MSDKPVNIFNNWCDFSNHFNIEQNSYEFVYRPISKLCLDRCDNALECTISRIRHRAYCHVVLGIKFKCCDSGWFEDISRNLEDMNEDSRNSILTNLLIIASAHRCLTQEELIEYYNENKDKND